MAEKKKLLIWGTGDCGLKLYKDLSLFCDTYQILYWGDNNKEKIGKMLKGIPIIGVDQIEEIGKEVDAVVIASQWHDEILKQLREYKISCEIITSVLQLKGFPYKRILIEISGKCNAKCKYCLTGNANINHEDLKGKFITVEDFEYLIDYLLNEKIIANDAWIGLFNWGEPFLNPDVEGIIECLNLRGLHYILSTNASICKTFDKEGFMSNLDELMFSMPGFSQKSYDRIHGFSFEKIKKNIEDMVQNYREKGFCGKVYIAYHLYQFSKPELTEILSWAKKISILVRPYYAYFNHLKLALEYLEGTMEGNYLEEAKKDLCLEHIYDKNRFLGRPDDYRCHQEEMLVIDEYGKLLLCCEVGRNDEDYEIGNILEMGLEEMKKRKRQIYDCKTCIRCKEKAMNWWIRGYIEYEKEFLNSLPEEYRRMIF